MCAPTIQVIMEILNNKKKVSHSPGCVHRRRSLIKQIDGYLLSSYINQKYIVKVRLLSLQILTIYDT